MSIADQVKIPMEDAVALDGFIKMLPRFLSMEVGKRDLLSRYVERLANCNNPADRAYYRDKIETHMLPRTEV